jgi:hypothetical protein
MKIVLATVLAAVIASPSFAMDVDKTQDRHHKKVVRIHKPPVDTQTSEGTGHDRGDRGDTGGSGRTGGTSGSAGAGGHGDHDTGGGGGAGGGGGGGGGKK